ncbi:MAG: phosphoribosyl-ATP pyrophosphohydrolase [Erysipelotrichaceae bacterium]
MKTHLYNKLIRDNIPEIIKASGKECDVKVLDDEEYIQKLKEKIIEEAKEVYEADENEIISELADILEIVEAIEKYYDIDHSTVEKKKQDKAIKNGKFEKKLLLTETREN